MTSLDTVRAALRGAEAESGREGGIHPVRLPVWTRREYGLDPMLSTAPEQTSGVRLELTTAATWLEIRLKFTRTAFYFVPFPPRPAVISVVVDGREENFTFDEGDVIHIDEDFAERRVSGEESVLRVALREEGVSREVVIWLPHTSGVEIFQLDADAPLVPSEARRTRWVHYGSSISHCLEAETPLGVWPVIAARSLDLDLYNLGLAGSAMLDGFAARTIRDTPADLITLKVGINVVNSGALRRRTFVPAVHSFLDSVRDGHPDTPILLISPIICPAHEDAPGPTEWSERGEMRGTSIPRRPMDGQLTLKDIRQILESIVISRREDDPRLSYVDGLELLGEGDLNLLPDGLHPNAEGYQLMGERVVRILRAQFPTLL